MGKRAIDWIRDEFSEFHQAKKRFNIDNDSENNMKDNEDFILDNFIKQFCIETDDIITDDQSLFFKLLIRADFIQIANEVRPIFYKNICKTFLFRENINEIVAKIDHLDLISHVKFDLLKYFLKNLNIQLILKKQELLTLKYRYNGVSFSQVPLTNIEHLTILPCAYKMMLLGSYDLNMSHLNFIIKLLKVHKLTIDGCNLNLKNKNIFLKDIKLTYLHASGCGIAANSILQTHFNTLKKELEDLDVSDCPLHNETLYIISNFGLKKLLIRNCLKKNGYFVGNTLWSEEVPFKNSIEAKVDLNLLFKEGCKLRENLRYLDISENHLEIENIKMISSLNLRELCAAKTGIQWVFLVDFPFQHTDFFNNNMQSINLKGVEITFQILDLLCNIPLKRLSITFDAMKELNEFDQLSKKPLVNSLLELDLDLKNNCQYFIFFISQFKLSYFQCKLRTWCQYNFGHLFWSNPNRKYLETLILLDGKLSEIDAEGISNLKLKRLELQPFLFDSKGHILKVLSSENLRCSVNSLMISGAYEIDDDHLNLILEFRNLEELSLKITGTNLTKVLIKNLDHLRSMKILKLKIYIGLNIDEEIVNLLCSLSGKTELTIIWVGLGKTWPLTFTPKAFNILSRSRRNSLQVIETPIRLEFVDCTLNWRCANALKNLNVENMVFSSCVFENFLSPLLTGNMIYTINEITLGRVEIDERQLKMLSMFPITKLNVFPSLDDFSFKNLPSILNEGVISKSLCVLKVGPRYCLFNEENILDTTLSCYESYSCADSLCEV